jgi:diguanylate cyclase (GGDEF)-like protein
MSQPSTLHQLVFNSTTFKKTIHLQEALYSVGRHPSCSIVIPSLQLSRHHATLLKYSVDDQDMFCIVDGDTHGKRSTNGFHVNGHKYLEYELKHGDTLVLPGDIRATYQIINDTNNSYYRKEEGDSLTTESAIFKATLSQAKSTYLGSADDFLNSLKLVDFTSLVELSPNPIIELDFAGNILYLNTAAIKIFKNIHQFQSEHPILANITHNQQHRNGNLVIREIKIESNYFEQYVHYLPEHQKIRIYVFNVTQRKEVERILKYKAFYDALTNLPNRYYFNQKLSMAITSARTNESQVALMFLDIDNFKRINDNLGHKFGDEVLRHFSRRIKQNLRQGDLLSRWGGDEFTVLLESFQDLQEIEDMAHRLLDCLKRPFQIGEEHLYVKSSIGISLYPRDGDNAENLLKNADSALYRTKENGRNHYQFSSPHLIVQTSECFQLENWLYQAIDKEELLLYYQPQINIQTGEIYGLEALVRWQHPKLGLVSPNKFIPLAEQNGMIHSIGEWVLRQACQQNYLWQKAGIKPFRMGVNLSSQQIQQPNIIQSITKILAETGLGAEWLELEVTESALMHDIDLARDTLQQLRNLGIDLSMDDFGTGYSSLGYLKQFPFQTLKIDQAFIKDLSKDNFQDIAIISAVIALGKGCNQRVIAEGVETEEQLELLKGLHCPIIQGYWFSRPLPAHEIFHFINQKSFHPKLGL